MRRIPKPGPTRRRPPLSPRLAAEAGLQRLTHVALEHDALVADGLLTGSFHGVAARKATLERLVLRDVDLASTRLDALTLRDLRLQNCDLANAVWRGASIDRVELIGCRITGLDVSDMRGSSLVFRECAGSLPCFRFAVLERVAFERCTLTEPDFQDATLTDAVFRACDLAGAAWYGAKMRGADLRGSRLDELRMRAGDLAGAVIDPVQLVAIARQLATLAGLVVRPLDGDADGR